MPGITTARYRGPRDRGQKTAGDDAPMAARTNVQLDEILDESNRR
jgi:hypothetical protein